MDVEEMDDETILEQYDIFRRELYVRGLDYKKWVIENFK